MKRPNLSAACLLGLLFITGAALADEVSVAVAANFTDVSRDIAPLFEQATGHSVKISYGSTGKLYAQIENGAPFDVFLAADTQRPARAEQRGLAAPGSRFIYARGQLVLWSARESLVDDGESFLKEAAFKHLALANPKTAPYGLAARQVMEHLGVWNDLQRKLVRGDSIAQAFQFAVTGNAEAGFVALSQVRAWQDGDAGSTWIIPADYYAPIEQAAVLLRKAETNAAARAFLDFLKGDAARAVIERYGYRVE